MFRQSYILFKEFLPKQLQINKLLTRQTLNSTVLAKHIHRQLKKTTLHPARQTSLSKQHIPFTQQYYSSKKVLKLRSKPNLSNLLSAKITQQSSRSSYEFMDDNVWKHLSQKKLKLFQGLAKDIPRKIRKNPMAIIFKNKESTEKQPYFVEKNLQTLRKIVKSQSQERHFKQRIHFDIINTKKANLKQSLRRNEERHKFIRRQDKTQLKLKVLSRMAQEKNKPEKSIIQDLRIGDKKSNLDKQAHLHFRETINDLTASKLVLQRKISLKKQLIEKIRKQRTQKREQKNRSLNQDPKYVSTYLTDSEQQISTLNLTFHIKRRFKTQHSDVDKRINHNTEKCQIKKNEWDFSNNAIDPW